jgi:hypothetical protein
MLSTSGEVFRFNSCFGISHGSQLTGANAQTANSVKRKISPDMISSNTDAKVLDKFAYLLSVHVTESKARVQCA